MEAKFEKSRLGHATELGAHDFILRDPRFQKPAPKVKARILELLGVTGKWSHQTFDLVMTSDPVEPLTLENVARHINDIHLIEVKSTRAAIANCGLSGFFFGSTETQFLLAAAVGERFLYAFVVLSDKNDYGRPYFCLLTSKDVLEKIQAKRVQFQVNFKTALADPLDASVGPWPLDTGRHDEHRRDALPSAAATGNASTSRRRVKAIRDTITGVVYDSETQAGKALCELVGGRVSDTFVWFKLARAFPDRFETMNAEGRWVPLDDATAPRGTTRHRRSPA